MPTLFLGILQNSDKTGTNFKRISRSRILFTSFSKLQVAVQESSPRQRLDTRWFGKIRVPKYIYRCEEQNLMKCFPYMDFHLPEVFL